MNIYVSNLSFTIQNEDLRGFFEEYGEVISAKVVMDKESNRSRGFGFVEMPDNASAEKAIRELNGISIDGRPVSVAEARPSSGEKRTFNNDRQRW